MHAGARRIEQPTQHERPDETGRAGQQQLARLGGLVGERPAGDGEIQARLGLEIDRAAGRARPKETREQRAFLFR